MNTRPKVKPPCKFAHSNISGSSSSDGARRPSSARSRPATQATISGSASTCGRATICGEASTKPAAIITSAGAGASFSNRKRVSRPKVAAMAAVLSTTTPVQPASA